MFKFLFLFIAFFALIGLVFGVSVVRLIFGGFSGGKKQQKTTQANQRRQAEQKVRSKQYQTKQSPKVITPKEGEYIDFEEVKD